MEKGGGTKGAMPLQCSVAVSIIQQNCSQNAEDGVST